MGIQPRELHVEKQVVLGDVSAQRHRAAGSAAAVAPLLPSLWARTSCGTKSPQKKTRNRLANGHERPTMSCIPFDPIPFEVISFPRAFASDRPAAIGPPTVATDREDDIKLNSDETPRRGPRDLVSWLTANAIVRAKCPRANNLPSALRRRRFTTVVVARIFAQHAGAVRGSRPFQAMISLTTVPWTSVRRKSRPA